MSILRKVVKMFAGHYVNILNYFDNKLTNVILEGLNNVVLVVKYSARGFRNSEYLWCVVYLYCGVFEVRV